MNQKDWEWEDLLAKKAREREEMLKKRAELHKEDAMELGLKGAAEPDEDEDASADARVLTEDLPDDDVEEIEDLDADGEEKEPKKRGIGRHAFTFFYAALLVVLTVLAIVFLRRVYRTMEEMRDNSPEEMVRAHLSAISDDDLLALFAHNSDYEDAEVSAGNLRAYLGGDELTIRRADKNVYDICKGNHAVFQAHLKTLRSVSHLGLLNYDIIEWDGFTTTGGGELYHVEIIAPSVYEITVNGRDIGDPVSIDPVEGFGDAGYYVELPTVNTYRIGNLTAKPEIRITESGREIAFEDGEVIDVSGDGAGGEKFASIEDAEIDFDAMGFATEWNLFMTDDLGGDLHGYWQLAPYFIEGTSMQKKAHDWATGIDITLTSFHTYPELSEQRIYDVVRYGPDAASYTVYMEKEMQLTRTNEEKRDIFESTIYLVRVDGEWKVANVRGVAEE